MIDPIDLARRMQRLIPWLDEAGEAPVRHRRFDAAPFGSALVTISPETRLGRNASANHNHIHLCGGAGLTRAGLDALCGLFGEEGIGTFFIRLTPGPGMAEARALIEEAGFVRNPWTRYPLLALTGEAEPPARTDLVVREARARDLPSARAAMGEAMWAGYAASLGKPGFHHFLALDEGARPVAHAAMAMREGLACLGWMSTAQLARRRGAQQALIAARVAKARALGAEVIVTETLTILAASHGNLRRAGFREVYERETFGRPDS